MREGKIPANEQEQNFYELALKVSGAVQAARWTDLGDGAGYICSFNGPHSLFVDTLRSLRSLAVAHQLGHVLMGERDRRINLLQRLIAHAVTTARYSVYYGASRDAYDVRGRTAHECIFNVRDGSFRCPNSQQGYSPFTTWTRGLAWAILGFAEQLEFLLAVPEKQIREALGHLEEDSGEGRDKKALIPRSPRQMREVFVLAATATADFFIDNTCRDGIPMWDTGAPNLHRLGNYLDRSADPFNAWEPVDSSAAVIAAQGLVRLGEYLRRQGQVAEAKRYQQAGLTVASALFDEPYLSTRPNHQGLLLHSVYHRPNGWDFVARGQKVPNGESSMWGDYHARELALLLLRSLRRTVQKLKPWQSAREPWRAYANCNTYTERARSAKLDVVRKFIGENKPGVVLDLGCNSSEYSIAALQAGARFAVGVDADAGALALAVESADRDRGEDTLDGELGPHELWLACGATLSRGEVRRTEARGDECRTKRCEWAGRWQEINRNRNGVAGDADDQQPGRERGDALRARLLRRGRNLTRSSNDDVAVHRHLGFGEGEELQESSRLSEDGAGRLRRGERRAGGHEDAHAGEGVVARASLL
jgi:hypothetical protein